MTAPTNLHRSRDGRMLCSAHARYGAPRFHFEGCDACAEARAKGIIRPNASEVSGGQRKRMGREAMRTRWIDWSAVRARKAAG